MLKTCFSNKLFLVYKKIIFSGVTGCIQEENVDLIVTKDSVDETIEGSKQVISNNMFLSEFLNARDTTRKLIS